MITRNQVVRLLALAAAADQRTTGQADVDLWSLVAVAERWSTETAARVIAEHAAAGGDRPRITPAAITARIRDIRRQAAATFELPVIPDHVSDTDYPRWLREQRDRHVSALLARWAETGDEPPLQLPAGPRPDPLGQRRVAAITAGAFRSPDGPGKRPPVDLGADRKAAYANRCPHCSAAPGQPCTRSTATGRARMQHPHPSRMTPGLPPSTAVAGRTAVGKGTTPDTPRPDGTDALSPADPAAQETA